MDDHRHNSRRRGIVGHKAEVFVLIMIVLAAGTNMVMGARGAHTIVGLTTRTVLHYSPTFYSDLLMSSLKKD